MGRVPPRRFHLIDAMILVAASAIGLAVAPATWDRLVAPDSKRFPERSTRAMILLRDAQDAPLPLLFAWSAALVAISLRPPRPRLRALATRPGFLACAAGVVPLGPAAIFWIENMFIDRIGATRIAPWPFHPVLTGRGPLAGYAVAGAWLALALLGLWRPDPGAIDRLGRALGVTWIVLTLLALIHPALSLL